MKMTRFPKKSLFSLVVLSLLAPTFAFAMGSGDKFVDAQTGRTYGVYKPSNTLNLKLHTFQSLLCAAGKEQWVAVSYGTGKKKLDIYETVATANPKVSKERKKRPTDARSLLAIVRITASNIEAKSQGWDNHGGVCPRNKLRRVPPLIEATDAMRAIPP